MPFPRDVNYEEFNPHYWENKAKQLEEENTELRRLLERQWRFRCEKHRDPVDGEYQIWERGYLGQGCGSDASFLGFEKSDSFKDACVKWFGKHPKLSKNFDPEQLADWGCKLYDNEFDARKDFG